MLAPAILLTLASLALPFALFAMMGRRAKPLDDAREDFAHGDWPACPHLTRWERDELFDALNGADGYGVSSFHSRSR